MSAADGVSRKRVVYIDHSGELSGAEIALWKVLTAPRGFDATVLLAENGPFVDKLRASGIDVVELVLPSSSRDLGSSKVSLRHFPIGAAWATLTYTYRLTKWLRANKPDIVHTNSMKAHVYGGMAARLARIPLVIHLRTSTDDAHLTATGARLMRLIARTLPTVLVANSKATLASAGSVRGPRRVIPSPVYAEQSHASNSRPTNRPLRLAMVGRISPWKGQDVFIRALAEAFPERNFDAIVVGAPLFEEIQYEQELRSLVEKYNLSSNVHFLGFQSNIAEILSDIDIMVHASTLPEPFGQVIIEALAAGCTVVATAAGGPLEIITDGVNGRLYKAGDHNALAKILRELAQDPEQRARLSSEALSAADKYSPAAIAKMFEEVYELASGTHGPFPVNQARTAGAHSAKTG